MFVKSRDYIVNEMNGYYAYNYTLYRAFNPLPDDKSFDQTEKKCRRHFKVHLKWKISII